MGAKGSHHGVKGPHMVVKGLIFRCKERVNGERKRKVNPFFAPTCKAFHCHMRPFHPVMGLFNPHEPSEWPTQMNLLESDD